MIKNNITINRVLIANMALLLLFALVLVYYVVVSNYITSGNYKVETLRNRINVLSESNGHLVSRKLIFENPSHLSLFATNNNMVKADNVTHLFESSDVAQR